MDAAADRLAAALGALGLEPAAHAPGEWTLRLPSAMRGAVGVALGVRERTLTMSSFFMRAPDVRHGDVHRRLLRRNLDLPFWRFAIDDAGDLFLTCVLDLSGRDEDAVAGLLDEVLGLLVTTVDEMYEPVLRTGFEVPEGTRVTGAPPGAAGR